MAGHGREYAEHGSWVATCGVVSSAEGGIALFTRVDLGVERVATMYLGLPAAVLFLEGPTTRRSGG
jgi:hypothetical protein